MNHLKRMTLLAITLVFVVSSVVTTFPVKAANDMCTIPSTIDTKICHDEFFSGNDIVYYDPNAGVCAAPASSGSGGPLTGNSNAEKIFVYLVGKGLTAQQAAGVLGNFQQESGFDPAIIQGGAIADENYTPVDGVGFGIAQWTFTARQGPLMALAQSSGRPVIDLSLQLDFLWQELNTTHSSSLASLKAATDPERAAYVFHRDFEGSADSEAMVIRVRGGNARVLYEQFKNLAPTTTSPTTPTASSGDCNSTAGGANGKLASFMGNDFKIYNQCEFGQYGGSWGARTAESATRGTICAEGCIPTSLAMIAHNLTGNTVTPDDTVNAYNAGALWNAGGPGAMTDSPLKAARDFNLHVEVIADKGNVAAYKEVFAKGGLVMAISTGSSPFLAGRHAIVLRGITSTGSFLVADPGRFETNAAPANQPSIEKILTDIRGDGMSVSYAFYESIRT